jgi:MerR family copper efflux transcriptional regulator
MERFTIGEIARQAEVGVDTVRYYERNRLLPEPARRLSGYREYKADDVRRLRFIRRARDLGFSLADIRELLMLSEDRERGVRGLKARAEARLVDACPGHGALDRCPILAALGEEV